MYIQLFLKKFEFLQPFSRPLRKLKKNIFCFRPENKKFVCINQQCFAFQIQMLTTKVLQSKVDSLKRSLSESPLLGFLLKLNMWQKLPQILLLKYS
jgi:hypothetical protein